MKYKYYRIHINELAYLTKKPKGLFAAVGNLVDQKIMNDADIDEYWINRKWFEANLPIPPFYSDGNTIKAITWYKNNNKGNEMFSKMAFYFSMAKKHDKKIYITYTNIEPGVIIYEDDYQIGVIDSKYEGEEFYIKEFEVKIK